MPSNRGAGPREARASKPKAAREAAQRPYAEGDRLGRNLYSHLAGELGREIVGGVFAPGALLPNVETMCARFGVSRTALREAYSVLAAKALIVARPKVGTKVRPKSDWNMLDPEMLTWHLQSAPTGAFTSELFVLRRMIEPEAAALAAAERAPEMLNRIAEAFERMERFKTGSGDLIRADLDFHMAILEATGNHFLTALGGLIQASLESAFRYSWEGANRIQDKRLAQHGAVLEAIASGDAGLARERMSSLLLDSSDDVREYLKHHDGVPAPEPLRRKRTSARLRRPGISE